MCLRRGCCTNFRMKNPFRFQSTIVIAMIKCISKFRIPLTFSRSRTPVSIVSRKHPGEWHVMDDAVLCKMLISHIWWTIDLGDESRTFGIAIRVIAYTFSIVGTNLISNWDWFDDGNSRKSEVDSDRLRHCSVLEPELVEVDEEEFWTGSWYLMLTFKSVQDSNWVYWKVKDQILYLAFCLN